MKSIWPLAALLTIGVGLSSVEGVCIFDPLQEYCSCLTVDLNSVMSIFPCLTATIFEFQGGSFEELMRFSSQDLHVAASLLRLPLARIIFANNVLSEDFVLAFVKAAYYISIKELVFENCTFVGNTSWQDIEGSSPKVFSLHFKNISSPDLFGRTSDISSLSNWMAKMQELTLTRSQITHIPCNISMHFRTLSYLDLSDNPLHEQGLKQSFCDGLFPMLELLRLQNSHLTSLRETCQTLLRFENLKDLDLSRNNFSHSGLSYSSCTELRTLRNLNLSDTGLVSIDDNLPPNIQILDLSRNRLQAIDIALSDLKIFILSNNALKALPSPESGPAVEVLYADGNMITLVHKHHLQSFKHLRTFSAGQNPYSCSCSSIREMRDLAKSDLEITGWPSGYVCESPAAHRGTSMNDVDLSWINCHKPPIIGLSCAFIFVVCIGVIICLVQTRCRLKRTLESSDSGDQKVHYRM
ncbi:monocyte differentiation antigen CD14 [Ambystoma mexicanum]|uniref:monocyte differentiation antigen CD14 n=1 Tax=Ambystoma mexicanum TaxID=8296 RepID=UPI0037E82407